MQVKYLREDGVNVSLVGAVAICNPWDLLVSVLMNFFWPIRGEKIHFLDWYMSIFLTSYLYRLVLNHLCISTIFLTLWTWTHFSYLLLWQIGDRFLTSGIMQRFYNRFLGSSMKDAAKLYVFSQSFSITFPLRLSF